MQLVSVIAHIFALLLVLAGISKLAQPAGTRDALSLAGLPGSLWLVRALAVGEVAVGAAVLVVGGPVAAAALATTYGSFAAFAWRQRTRAADCGCFGDARAPAGLTHVVVDLLGTLAGGGAAVLGTPVLVEVLEGQPLGGIPAMGLLVLLVALLRLTLTALPELLAAVAASRGEALT